MESSLVRQRGALKAKLTRFQQYVNNFSPSTATIDDLESRLVSVNDLESKFESIQLQIEKDGDIDDAERTEFENSFHSALSTAKRIIREHEEVRTLSNMHSAHAHTHSRLPEITLPKFDGRFSDWISFRDTFQSLVHSNNTLSSIDKFQYLKTSLRGEAARVIQAIVISHDNYNIAWKKLIDRYEDTENIILKHVKCLFELSTISRESYLSLSQLADDVSNHLETIRSLDTEGSELKDRLLIHLVCGKLDINSKREWERHIADKKSPTIDVLLKFIISRSKLLEKLNVEKPNPIICKSLTNNHGKTNKSHSQTFVTTQSPVCTLCKGAHMLYTCATLRNLSPAERLAQVKSLNVCFNCLKYGHNAPECRSSSCRICNKKHNTLLHLRNETQKPNINNVASTSNPNQENDNCANSVAAMHCSEAQQLNTATYLPTAVVTVFDNTGTPHTCRALLDSASQSHFVTENMCTKLGLRKCRTHIPVYGINQQATPVHFSTHLLIKSNFSNYYTELHCLVLNKLSNNLPTERISNAKFKVPADVHLADPQYFIPANIDLLIGAQLFWDLLGTGRIKIPHSHLTLIETHLGWVLSGSQSKQLTRVSCNLSINEKLNNQVHRFWEIETYTNTNMPYSREEKICEKHFSETTKRDAEGRFIVKIPFKENLIKLGTSYHAALKRFYNNERKLEKSPMKEEYINFMQEYESLGHMTELANDNSHLGYYLPHHAVFKEDSTTTKLRVVFDGSQKTNSGLSLNDVQMSGPALQADLFSILLRFRQHSYVLKADIEKMYRQVLIDPDHRSYQKILWRPHSSLPLKVYQLNTVTYGTSSAPFLAMRAIKQLAIEHSHEYPLACKVINNDMYVDDLITGANSKEELIKVQDEIYKILLKGKFHLRKWVSNDSQLLHTHRDNLFESIPLFSESTESKTLGIYWNCKSDKLQYAVKPNQNKQISKRVVLSEIAQIFDPLGLVGPVIVIAKLILQELYKTKLNWDDHIPADIQIKWIQYREYIRSLNQLSIPRHAVCRNLKYSEMHGFCDASASAYGACIYLRTIDESGAIHVNLLCARSRVAPIKSVTLPRLELSGALVLAQLSNKVKNSLTLNISKEFYWSDSTITLCWIKGNPNRWKQFVAHRVSEIQELTKSEQWHHVPSGDNPADIISRGMNPTQLMASNPWWHGPMFLYQSDQHWPRNALEYPHEIPEEKATSLCYIAQASDNYLGLFTRYSSIRKLKRVTAYMLRFIQNCKLGKNQIPSNITVSLTTSELHNAEQVLIRIVQTSEFPTEIRNLTNGKAIPSKSRVLSLNPFLDEDAILRVGGRLENSTLSIEQKHPILLPGNHPLAKLIILNEHLLSMHGGTESTLASIRQRYWLTAGRSNVKKLLRKCLPCFRTEPKSINPLMGQLPRYRIEPCRAFTKTGIDYAGPFLVKERVMRNKKFIKVYVAIFVCMSTKAVHIELVTDLTTQSFLGALNRFIARRGKITDLYTDNGTYFVGANNELKNLKTLFNSELSRTHIINSLADNDINWHFMPPRAPHFGGLWEAAVKSVKRHMKRVIGNAHLDLETFHTLVTQIEAILNSRPLTPLSHDPNDMSALTPGHFLIGDALTAPAHPDITQMSAGRLTRWQHVEMLRQHIWKRWSREYTTLLQQRTKWKSAPDSEPRVGQLLVIRDDNLPPLRWLLGRVLEVHRGADGVIRVLSIKTASGVVKRSVNRVCVLPLDTNVSD